MNHRSALALPLLAAVVLVAGACGDDANDNDPTTAGSEPRSFAGPLAEATAGGDAVTYDTTTAPIGAELEVSVTPGDGETTFELTASGMQPDRGYAVHAHVNACGATGDVAGPHFQHDKDPAATPDAPSSDPAYANPENEVWLELATDADGTATASATVPFTFTADAPQSIVVHADEMTMTEPGTAGTAGDRIACLTTALG